MFFLFVSLCSGGFYNEKKEKDVSSYYTYFILRVLFIWKLSVFCTEFKNGRACAIQMLQKHCNPGGRLFVYNISIKQKRSKQEQKEGKQMLIECPANTRLQDYLLQNDIHILTACGGRGNCAKCVVRIVKGHATVNTMDQIWFSEEQLLAGYRLGCHVYAKEPLTVEIPN